MATVGDLRYNISVDRRGLKRGERDLERFRQRGRGAFRELDKSATQHGLTLRKLQGAIIPLTSAYAGFAALRGFARLSDQAVNLRNQIRAATKETGEFSQVSQRLADISKETLTPLRTSVNLYREIARLRPELNSTLEEEATFVRAINQAAQISGASTVEVGNALRQLSQGLAGGILRAEEFNSIIENTPEIAQRIGRGMGTTVGQLRRLVIEGKVLSGEVFAAILSQAEAINEDFGALERTSGMAATNLKTAVIELAAAINDSFGAGSAIVGTLEFLTGVIDGLTTATEAAGRALRGAEQQSQVSAVAALYDPGGLGRQGAARREAQAHLITSTTPFLAQRQAAAQAQDMQLRQRNMPQPITEADEKEEATAKARAAAEAKQRSAELMALEKAQNAAYAERQQIFADIYGADAFDARLQRLEQNYQAELGLYENQEVKKLELTEQYAAAREKAEKDHQKGTRLANASTVAQAIGGYAELAQVVGQYSKSAFETAKALGIAQATISTFVGAAKALELGPIIGPIAMGGIIATGLAQVAQIAAQQPPATARRFGGALRAGQLARVGEDGPELFTSGSQNYILPSSPGAVVPNNRLGAPVININNFSGATVSAQETALGVDLTIRERRELAENMSI